MTQKRQAGLSKNTVRLIRACLSAMLAEAADDGIIKANPAVAMSRRSGRKGADSLTRRNASRLSDRSLKLCSPLSSRQYARILNITRCS